MFLFKEHDVKKSGLTIQAYYLMCQKFEQRSVLIMSITLHYGPSLHQHQHQHPTHPPPLAAY